MKGVVDEDAPGAAAFTGADGVEASLVEPAFDRRAADAEARLLGSALDERDLDEAGDLVAKSLAPLADPHASPRYRRRIAAALVKRALAEARDEAKAA